jgi:flagellar motor switch protein FliN/FliY
MAPKKATTPEPMEFGDNSAELDQAIDDLRGVLKADSDGAAAIGNDFAADFPAATEPVAAFSSDFGAAEADIDTDFGGSGDFGSEFSGSTFGETSFGGALPNASTASTPASEPGSGMQANMGLIMDIPIDVQIILGSSRMQVASLMNLNEGAIISLDRRIGEPVDLMVNGRLIGRGEITVMEDDETRFGIRLIEVKSVAKS